MREVYSPEVPEKWMDDGFTPERWKWHEPVRYGFPRGAGLMLRAKGMTGQSLRLLLGLLAHAGWENRVTESVARVARASGVGPRSVTRALRVLEAAHLVHVDRSTPTLPRVTVSPRLVWQGRPHLLYKARKAFDERCRQSEHQRTDAAQHDADTAALAAAVALPSSD